MRDQRKHYRSVAIIMAISLMGCSRSHGEDISGAAPEADQASFPPSKQRLLSVLAPDFRSQPDARQECLGRLIFDVPKSIQWGTNFHNFGSIFNGRFSERILDRGDVIEVGDAKIAVFAPSSSTKIKEILGTTPGALLLHLRKRQNETDLAIEEMTKKSPRNEQEERDLVWFISARESSERALKEHEAAYEKFDTGLPNTEAYWTKNTPEFRGSDSVYRAYMVRGDYVFVFESGVQLSPSLTRETHQRQFLKLLTDFRPRKPDEIPTELGICIPYGFIPDDGTTFTDIKRSIRWPDAPGVIYTIHTGYVDRHHLKLTPLTAVANASVGLMGSPDEKKLKQFFTQRIGPRSVKFGGVSGEQGGIAAKITMAGEPPYETYSVFSGYAGWMGIAALPYMLVEMRTFTTMQAPELKSNPPPFKQSMDRLDHLLTSMRLRPTTPEMPEIAAARKD